MGREGGEAGAAGAPPGRLLVYDGDCGFCTWSAAWIARRWPAERPPEAVPWQRLAPEVAARAGLTRSDFERAAWWIEGASSEEGSRAVASALAAARRPWSSVGRALLAPPLSWLAPTGYRVVARYRHRLPGGTPACRT